MRSLLRSAFCVLRKWRTALAAPIVAFLMGSAAFVALACTDVGTSPSVPVALAFDTLPSPSVIFGDTLRNIDGVATPLTGHAYNADGKEIAGAPIFYFEPDADTEGERSVIIDPATGFLIAKAEPPKTSVIIRAQVGQIPSQTGRTLEIVHSPDTVDRGAGVLLTKRDTLNYAGTDSIVLLTASLSLRVLDRPNPAKPDSGLRGVRSWPVRYSVVSPAGMDTLLVNEAGNRSMLDTTSTDGIASRKIRLRAKAGSNLSTGVPDSVIVEATARNPQGVLRGAPIRYVIILRKTS